MARAPPNQYAAPTLTISLVQPAQPIEGQPLQLSFQLTNNSSVFTHSGAVVGSGVVVADQSLPLNGALLARMTASGPHSDTNVDGGSNSPRGCGNNSSYQSTWHITRDNP